MFIKRNNSIDKELREMNKVLNNLKSQLNAIEEKSTEYLEFFAKVKKNALDLYTVDTTTITQKKQNAIRTNRKNYIFKNNASNQKKF